MSFQKVPFTQEQLDESIRAIAGGFAVHRDDPGWHYARQILFAGINAWVEGHPEDQHTAIIRSAAIDMDYMACLNPETGCL